MNWPELYQLLPSLFVLLIVPNSGNGSSNCRRVMLGLAPGYKGAVHWPTETVVQNGLRFAREPPRFELLVCIATVRELSVFRVLSG